MRRGIGAATGGARGLLAQPRGQLLILSTDGRLVTGGDISPEAVDLHAWKRKQISRKLESIWRSTDLEDSRIPLSLRDSLSFNHFILSFYFTSYTRQAKTTTNK